MSNDYRIVIDALVVETGHKKGQYWRATINSGTVLSRLDLFTEVNRSHHQYVKKIVEFHYPGSRFEPIGANADGGWIFHIKIRSK